MVYIGEGNGNPLQCPCLENPRDGGAWWAAVYGVTESRTRLTWLSSSSSGSMVYGASLVAQLVKNLSAMRETWVLSLGREDALEESTATHSSILTWRILMHRGAWQATIHRVAKSQTWLMQLSMHTCMQDENNLISLCKRRRFYCSNKNIPYNISVML